MSNACLAAPADTKLDALAADVRAVRARLVDEWEATAIIESLGYTDARIRRDFGLRDASLAGEFVFPMCRAPIGPADRWAPKAESALGIAAKSAASTLIYAVPWLTVFLALMLRPDAMQVPASVAPALVLGLMFSLVASGGFVQVIVRRGEFYVGLEQPGMARAIVLVLVGIGMAMCLAMAMAGLFVGWYFELFAWPPLILGADAFILLCMLWLVCGSFAIRQRQWRVAVSFGIGFLAFAALRAAGADAVTSQLTATMAVATAALAQMPHLFPKAARQVGSPGTRLPRLSVLAYCTVPYFWYGTAYFAFLFADRLTAGTAMAVLDGAPFGVPLPYDLGMELALLTLLVAASGVEVAGALFGRAFRAEATREFDEDPTALAAALRRHHRRAVTATLATFAVTAVAVALVARGAVPGSEKAATLTTLLAGDAGYGCLAVGLLNTLVLFEVRRPWTVVWTLTFALGINLGAGYVLSHTLGVLHAVDGLILGAAYFAVASSTAVGRALRRPGYAYALG